MKAPTQALLLVVAAVAGGVVVWIGKDAAARRKLPHAAPQPAASPGVVRLDPEAQQRAGIRTAAPSAFALRPQLEAYGRLEEDPSRSFVVRAPLSGTVMSAPGRAWPALGQPIADGAEIGLLQPRLNAVDLISLTGQLNAARADLRAAEAAAGAARTAFERARLLNDDRKNVSDRARDEAESRWKSEDARWRAAQESTRLLEAALHPAGPGGRAPLVAVRGGEVAEVMAQPGEAIESGQPILRLSRFDQLLARVALPVGQTAPPGAGRALLTVIGFEDRPVSGELVSFAAAVDPRVQATSLVFRVAQPGAGLRPGLAVTARIGLAGEALRGCVVPRAAVVHYGGRRFVYLQTGPDTFQRREPGPLDAVENGFFTRSLDAADRVVVSGAQALLSEENKSHIALEVEGS